MNVLQRPAPSRSAIVKRRAPVVGGFALFATTMLACAVPNASAQSTPAPAGKTPEPCGYVDFVPYAPPAVDGSGRRFEHISLVVHFPDGSTQIIRPDYPFTYPSIEADPFVPANRNLPALFQFPPPGSNVPSLLEYVIQHTTPEGYTKLVPCLAA